MAEPNDDTLAEIRNCYNSQAHAPGDSAYVRYVCALNGRPCTLLRTSNCTRYVDFESGLHR